MNAYNFEWLWDYLVHEHLYSLVQAYTQSVKNDFKKMGFAQETRNVEGTEKPQEQTNTSVAHITVWVYTIIDDRAYPGYPNM